MKKHPFAWAALVALGLAACSHTTTREVVYTPTAAAAPATVLVEAPTAPPAPRVETPPPAPPGSVWVPGYWNWTGSQYSWVEGHYDTARSGYSWVPQHWEQEANGRWHLIGGTWVQQ
jgi:hypothetical protein